MKRICSLSVAVLLTFAGLANASIITFNEVVSSGVGFNGQVNPFLISTDGQYRVEAFWLNASGHFHLVNNGPTDFIMENNHNNSSGAPNQIQGIRITRVDGGAFDLVSMDLLNQAAIGQLTNFTTGAGTFSLHTDISGTPSNPATVLFGTTYSNVTHLVIADPGRAGGTSYNNLWDNLNLQQTQAVPEPSSILVFTGLALSMGAGGWLRKRRQLKAA